MDSVSGSGSSGGGGGIGGVLKEIIDSPMAPHNKIKDKKNGGGKKGGGDKGGGGGAAGMIGNVAGSILGG